MKLCGHVLRDALGCALRWITGTRSGAVITCDLEPGHQGDHSAGDVYGWED